jgi:HSP20 family molecular chaperone IbpA
MEVMEMNDKSAAVQRAREQLAIRAAKPDGIIQRANHVFEEIARRAYEIFETRGRRIGHECDDWLEAERDLLHPLHVHIVESDDSLRVRAEVPGFSEDEVEVSIEPRQLAIAGKRQTAEDGKFGKTLYSETCSDEILRIVSLPVEIDPRKAVTTLRNGVLEFTLPKAKMTSNA